MMLRAAAWMLLIVSMAFATMQGAPAAAPAITRGGYRIVTGDFHVHGFPGDGGLPPWDIRRESARRGLDVVGISNHNQMLALRLDRALFAQPPHPVLLPGEEITAPGYHLIALGIREAVDWRLPLLDAIRAVHAQGGVAIAAHPTGDGWQQLDPATLAALDGVEVAHPITDFEPEARGRLDALYARARQFKPTIAAIGSSDFHFGAPIGSCHTRLLVRELSRNGVLEAIRTGRTVAYDAGGGSYGPAEWVAEVSSSATPTSADSASHHLAMFGAWGALLVLTVFGLRARHSP